MEGKGKLLFAVTSENATKLLISPSHWEMLTKDGIVLALGQVMARRILGGFKPRPKPLERLTSLPYWIAQRDYIDEWRFDSSDGISFETDNRRGIARLILENGDSIEIDASILWEFQRRYEASLKAIENMIG